MIDEDTDVYSYWEAELNVESIAKTINYAVDSFCDSPLLYRRAAINESNKFKWHNISEKSILSYKDIINNK